MATPIYHFTHIDNLQGILADGELVCDRTRIAREMTTRNIAYGSLKRDRLNTVVEVPPGGTLGDYVPFYFGTRSPMMLTYQSGNVTGQKEDLDELVYLASTAERVADSGIPFAFTDGHPVKEPKAFFNDLTHLGEVDLPLMKQRNWFDTDAYPDRKRKRQAEFLVWKTMPWSLILALGARTASVRAEVERLVQTQDHIPRCLHRPDWYYD